MLTCFKRTLELELQITRKCVAYWLLTTILQMAYNHSADLYSVNKESFRFNIAKT